MLFTTLGWPLSTACGIEMRRDKPSIGVLWRKISILRIDKCFLMQNIYFKLNEIKQGKSEGFDSCDGPSNLKLDSNRRFFSPCDREI